MATGWAARGYDDAMRVLGIPVVALGLACFAVAAVFSVVYPHRAVVGWRHVVLRWGHAGVWVLLGLSCLLRAWMPGHPGLANVLAGLAAAAYAVFLIALLTAA
jgi:hypothetical protein